MKNFKNIFKIFNSNVIQLKNVSNLEEKLDLLTFMKQFLLRVLYKSAKNLPCENQILAKFLAFIATKFNKGYLETRGIFYSNHPSQKLSYILSRNSDF